jgi:hypothetical protein
MSKLTPDWRPVFYATERRLSPRLEALLRTDAAQDGIAVANGLTRLLGRSIRDAGTSVLEAVGLPSGRQLSRLQRAIDSLSRQVADAERTAASETEAPR